MRDMTAVSHPLIRPRENTERREVEEFIAELQKHFEDALTLAERKRDPRQPLMAHYQEVGMRRLVLLGVNDFIERWRKRQAN